MKRRLTMLIDAAVCLRVFFPVDSVAVSLFGEKEDTPRRRFRSTLVVLRITSKITQVCIFRHGLYLS